MLLWLLFNCFETGTLQASNLGPQNVSNLESIASPRIDCDTDIYQLTAKTKLIFSEIISVA
jgi:hypothetical protein